MCTLVSAQLSFILIMISGKCNELSDMKAKREKVGYVKDGLKQRLRGRVEEKKCGWWENEMVQKVTEGGSHQNANVVWDIYCRVLMQFKTGSLSCGPSPSPCWALINQPLKADVTWIALHTAAIRLYHQCGNQTTAEKFMKMPPNNGCPRQETKI